MRSARQPRATGRARRAAVAVTLGLAGAASLGACEVATDYACRAWEHNRYCCERSGGEWSPHAHRCDLSGDVLVSEPRTVPGPFVPPDLPRARPC